MLSKLIGQSRVPTGMLKQLASVQQTIAQNGSLSNTPMWFDGADLNSSTAAMASGLLWCDETTGNWYRYAKATVALACGQLVSFAAPTTGTVTAAGSTVREIITNINTTSLGNLVGSYLWTLDAVGTYLAATTPFSQSLRVIKSHTTGAAAHFVVSVRGSIYGNSAYDPDPFPAVPTNGSAVHIITPYGVIVATGATPPIGVALGDVTAGNYTILQVAGLAMVQASNSVAATVIGKAGVATAAGVMSGPTAGTMTAANLDAIVGTSMYPLYAIASATISLVPTYVNFLGT